MDTRAGNSDQDQRAELKEENKAPDVSAMQFVAGASSKGVKETRREKQKVRFVVHPQRRQTRFSTGRVKWWPERQLR